MKHPPSQMVWGAMCRNGVAALSFLPPGTTMKYEWAKIRPNALRKAKTSHASSQL